MTGDWTDQLPDEPAGEGSGDAWGQPGTPGHSGMFDHVYGSSEDGAGTAAELAPHVDEGQIGAYDGPAELEDRDDSSGDWGTELPDAGENSLRLPGLEYGGDGSGDSSPEHVPDNDRESVISPDQVWANAIGSGAVDPSGAHPAVLGSPDLDDPSGPAYDLDPEWFTLSDLDTEHWTQPGLLDGLDPLPTTGAGGDAAAADVGGAAAIEALWERMSPGRPIPTTDSGSSDLTAALDLLAELAASSSPLLDVIDAARRLVAH